MVTTFACTVCGQDCGFLNDPCMACVRVRARVAMTGRCPWRLEMSLARYTIWEEIGAVDITETDANRIIGAEVGA